MTTYRALLVELPVITPTHHSFLLAIYDPAASPSGSTPAIIGMVAFTKDPTETWPEAATRCRHQIQDFLDNYHQQTNLNLLVSTWLLDQEWTT